ncbi:hypothetical protein DFH06DRAFT_1337811 [Mycena polygramma]|nr:hypothetical protein DFH06DRAFT_1337811 [Mycena polygramma]
MCLHRPPSPIGQLPVELLLNVFEKAIAAGAEGVYLSGHTFYLLTDVRDGLAQVNSLFRRIIHEHPAFWTQLHIDCTTSPDFVQRHVSRLDRLTIEVSIVLTDPAEFSSDDESDKSPNPSSPPSSAPAIEDVIASVRQCLLEVRPSMHLWRDVHIWVSTDVFFLDPLDILRPVGLPQMTTFSFCCPSLGSPEWPCAGLLLDAPPIFARTVPRLTNIRLLQSAMPWGDSNYFGQLEALDVQSIPALAWPTIPAFVATLTSSSNLRVLILGGGGVIGGHSLVITPFVLPSLTSLTIYYSSEAGRFIRLLAAGTFPALTDFTASNFDHAAWASAYFCNFFPQIERMTISCRRYLADYSHVAILIRRLRSVVHLDVSAATDCYARELLRTSSVSCPELTWLSVGQMEVPTLNKLVALRAKIPGRRIERVDYCHYYDTQSDVQRALFDITRRYVDVLVLDPPFS